MYKSLQTFFSSRAYAVVGVSSDREKYGNIAYRFLRSKQFPVYAVNPHLDRVEGDKCYRGVDELPDEVQSVVVVVPPHITEEVVKACKVKGIKSVWMQPGAESLQAIDFARRNSITCIDDSCIMVMLSSVPNFAGLASWLKHAATVYSD